MPECAICLKSRSRQKDYKGLPVCKKCFREFDLGEYAGVSTLEDPLLVSRLPKNGLPLLDGLNAFCTGRPKSLSPLLLMFSTMLPEQNTGDKWMVISSFIVASRAILINGSGSFSEKTEIPPADGDPMKEVELLTALSSQIILKYLESLGPLKEIENEEEALHMEAIIAFESDMFIFELMNDMLKRDDDGVLKGPLALSYHSLMDALDEGRDDEYEGF